MPRNATGTIYESNGKLYAQVTIGKGKRRSFVLPTCTECDAAEARAALLAELAGKLRRVGREDVAQELLELAAGRDGKASASTAKPTTAGGSRTSTSGSRRSPRGGP